MCWYMIMVDIEYEVMEIVVVLCSIYRKLISFCRYCCYVDNFYVIVEKLIC